MASPSLDVLLAFIIQIMKIQDFVSRLDVPKNLTVVVTGGNSGVGFAFSKHILSFGWRVILAVRSVERGQRAKSELLKSFPHGRIDVMELDLAKRESIESFVRLLIANKEDVHAFYCNAGVYRIPFSTTYNGLEMTCATNFVSNVLLYELLKDYFLSLKHQVKLVLTTSVVARFSAFHESDFYCKEKYSKKKAYSRSKVAINCFYNWLINQCSGTNILPLLVHPGITYTPLIDKAYHGKRFKRAAQRFVRITCHKPEKASLAALYVVSNAVSKPCLCGPRGLFHISGFPKVYKLHQGNLKNYQTIMNNALSILDIA